VPRKVKLRVLDEPELGTRTIVAMRERLGGRAEGLVDPLVGTVVTIRDREPEPAVVLFADGEHAHVSIRDGIIRRVAREDVAVHGGEASPALAKLAADTKRFAALTEGDRVELLAAEGRVDRGTLIERCRFGALVERADGVVIAVGFRRIWRSTEPVS
jgi:hypothetical protein